MKVKETRQDEATARRETRKKRSNKEQLVVLNNRLGKGVGAERERIKLIEDN